MTKPRVVSVIVGTRNRPDTLRDALASIRALEGPDLTFEILVGDNGTTPETPGVVAAFGGVYDRTDTYGCPAARNLAMRKMSGEFVAFLDDDDVWLPGNIRPQIALLDAQPELAAAFGQIVVSDQNLKPLGDPWPTQWPADNDIYVQMLSGYFPQVGGTVVRGDIARRYGLMDESLIGDSDWDWQLRITSAHKVGFVPVPSVNCRGRPPGTSDKLQITRAGYTRKIFLRFAPRTLGRWRNPVAVLKSYFACMTPYYDYFVTAAEERARSGDAAGARFALWHAFWLNPNRLVKNLMTSVSLRGVVRAAITKSPLPRGDAEAKLGA